MSRLGNGPSYRFENIGRRYDMLSSK